LDKHEHGLQTLSTSFIFIVSACLSSEAIAVKQSQVDKLYASLKDLSACERREKLDEVLKLYMLKREMEDIEQWIAERELVAGSQQLGQDLEHVMVSSLELTVISLYFWLHPPQSFTICFLISHHCTFHCEPIVTQICELAVRVCDAWTGKNHIFYCHK
jgi:hypothetical protein